MVRRSQKCDDRAMPPEIRAIPAKKISRANGGNPIMSVLLIEPILDRYVAQVEKRDKDWKAKEVAALLLRLRKEILDCLR
jgi:hypothetical protein